MRRIGKALFAICAALILMPFGTVHAESVEPRLMITAFEIENEYIMPGEDFKLSLTIKNVNTENLAESILISGSTENNEIVPSYGISNQAYIAELQPEEEQTIEMEFHVQEQLQDRYSVAMQFTFSFVGELADTNGEPFHYGSSAVIAIPIDSTGTLNVESLVVVEQGTVGTPIRITAQLENSGELQVENVVMHVSGDANQEIAIGTIAAGVKKFNEAYLQCDKVGTNNLSIYFTYTDSEDNSFQTKAYDYVTTIAEKTVTTTLDGSDNGDVQSAEGIVLEWWQITLLAVAVVLLVGTVTLTVKKNKK